MSLIRPPGIVAFDFNGTLVDDIHIAYGSVRKIFETYGIPCPTLEQYREEITADFMEFYYRRGFPRTTTAGELNSIRQAFYKLNRNNTRIRPNVSRTLDWLLIMGFRTVIVSAEITTVLLRCLIQNGLQRKFDFVRAEAWGSENAKSKVLLQVAEIFDVQSRDMIYVDDTVSGLADAKNIGVIPVAFTNLTGYNSESRLLEVTDLRIREIDDLTELLKT